eukprot:3564233-Amphidinium_carterae.1
MKTGYRAGDSHKWLLERDLEWRTLTPGPPPSTLRQQFDSPNGVFPQNWPEPDEDPSEDRRESHLVAALIMDDYDNRGSQENETFPDVPFENSLSLRQRILEASIIYGVDSVEVDSAAHLTFGRQIEVD